MPHGASGRIYKTKACSARYAGCCHSSLGSAGAARREAPAQRQAGDGPLPRAGPAKAVRACTAPAPANLEAAARWLECSRSAHPGRAAGRRPTPGRTEPRATWARS
eukprot:691418-Rhodomonas_salina.3